MALTSAELGNSVNSIGEWAFADCTSLTSIRIPNSVNSIENAFKGCPLEKIEINSKEIGSWFSRFETLTSLTLGDSVNSIGNRAFGIIHKAKKHKLSYRFPFKETI